MTAIDEESIEHLVHIVRTIDEMRDDIRILLRPIEVLEEQYLSMSNCFNRIDIRLTRPERHLDLTEI